MIEGFIAEKYGQIDLMSIDSLPDGSRVFLYLYQHLDGHYLMCPALYRICKMSLLSICYGDPSLSSESHFGL